MEKFVYFSDDSKDSICSQSLKEKINQVSRRLEFELEDTAVEPCDPQCSQFTPVNNKSQLGALSTHQDQEKSAKCHDPTSPKKINQSGSISQEETEQFAFNSNHTLTCGTHHLFLSNQLMSQGVNTNSASSTLGIVNIHRPWERSTMHSVSESRTECLQNSEIRWLLEDSNVVSSQNSIDDSQVLGQSLISPPAEFCDDSVPLLKKTWSLPSSDEPLDLSTKNKATTYDMTFIDALESQRTQTMTHQGMEQSRLNMNQFSDEMIHHGVNHTLIKKSHSSTAIAQDTHELLHESQIKQSLSMLGDENEYPVNTSAIKHSVSAEVSAPENTETVSQLQSREIKEENDLCSLLHQTENETDGIAKDSEDTVQNAWAFLNEEPLSMINSADDTSLSSPVPTNNVYSPPVPSSAITIVQNPPTDIESASPESSALPSFTFLHPDMDIKGSAQRSHEEVTDHINFSKVNEFEPDDNSELPSLTLHRPRLQCDEMVANNPDLSTTTKVMESHAGQDSIHYTADVSETQLSDVEFSGDSSILETKQTSSGSVWSVKSAVQSLTTPSIKMRLCKINSTSNSQPADVNTAFVTAASSTSENSYAPNRHSSRFVEGESHCDESTIVSISPPDHKALSSVVSCPSTPDMSNKFVIFPYHNKLPSVIRKPTSFKTTVQASSTPRHKSVCAESAKPKTLPFAKDNQNLLRVAMKSKLSSNCESSESILNLGFSKDVQSTDRSESQTRLNEGKTKAHVISEAVGITQDVTEDTQKSSKGKHPRKSLFKSLKRQLLCGNPEISMRSFQNETTSGTCFRRPLTRPVQHDVKKQSPTKRNVKIPNLAIPHCTQGVTSITTLAFVTLNRTSESSNKTSNSWCKQLETKMSPKLATNSKAGTTTPSPQIRLEDTHPATGQKEQVGMSSSASIGTSTSSLSMTVKSTMTKPLLQNEIEKESQIKRQPSSSVATSYQKDQNCTKYVTLVPKLFGDDKEIQSNSPVKKLELNINDNSPLNKMKKTVAKKSLTTQSAKTIDTECPPRYLRSDDSEYFKLPMDPEKYLIMRREQKRQRHCHQSSSSSDTSTTSLPKRRPGTQNTEAASERMETVMAREVGRITAEWLTTFMNNSNMKYFQSRYEDENCKQVLQYLCRQCCIKVTESDTDPTLITVTKSRCSRSPTEHDVRRLVRRTRRQ